MLFRSGFEYIQRESDDKPVASAGESKLYSVFKKAGYTGSESDFYTEFFPDATPEDKSLVSTAQGTTASKKMSAQNLLGFNMPDFSDPFAAMGSINSMFGDDTTDSKIQKAETYTPKRSTYFQYFEDETDQKAPSYFD